MHQVKTLSVIVPAYNAVSTLERCLVAIRASVFTDYELIVVDDGSTDDTSKIAALYADKVILLPKNASRLSVRFAGFKAAAGSIFLNVDSDVEVKADSLLNIVRHFEQNSEIGALTGLLAKESPRSDFYSAYKHLYMNFIYSRLPNRITFLYGSIFAISRSTFNFALDNFSAETLHVACADDTEFGQFLASNGIIIKFAGDLEVFHLKSYNCFQLLRNDFIIPRDFARILMSFARRIRFNPAGPAFLHASYEQICAIISVYSSIVLAFVKPELAPLFLLIWLLCNLRFFYFLKKNKGTLFLLKSLAFTLLDQFVMGVGVIAGFIDIILGRLFRLLNSRQSTVSNPAAGFSNSPILPARPVSFLKQEPD